MIEIKPFTCYSKGFEVKTVINAVPIISNLFKKLILFYCFFFIVNLIFPFFLLRFSFLTTINHSENHPSLNLEQTISSRSSTH
jgi:hypothetical protein